MNRPKVASRKSKSGKPSNSISSSIDTATRIAELEQRVTELIDTIDAIRKGEVDGLIVSAPEGEQIYTLESAEHPYRVLVEEMSEGAFTLVENEIVSYSNKSFANLVGAPLEKIVGRKISETLSTDKTFESVIKSAWDQGFSRSEVGIHSPSGVRPLLLSANLIDQRGLKSLCVIVTDLTEQKRNEALKREQIERLNQVERLETERHIAETANRAKSDFLANMSHEIRTPLGAILGFAQLMNDPQQTFQDRQDCVKTILRNGELLSRVINEVLDLSKIESDKMEIESIEFDPRLLIEDVSTLMRLQAEEKGVTLKIEYMNKIPPLAVCDPTRIRQILFNIIGNAVKFTSAGHIAVRISLSESNTQFSTFNFEVSDSGSGMSLQQRDRIFQPFMQADNTMTRKHGGSGLGLYLSRKLARALSGDIVITKSEPNVGTVFLITIPIKPIWTQKVVGSVLTQSGSKELLLIGCKVLVVDDAPDNRVLVSRFLKAAGAEVECASCAVEGVKKAIEGSFDVVLMDIQMPNVDGFEALERLRSLNYQKPVFALTAHAMKGDRERCLNAGFNNHLVKPIDRQVLIRSIADLE